MIRLAIAFATLAICAGLALAGRDVAFSGGGSGTTGTPPLGPQSSTPSAYDGPAGAHAGSIPNTVVRLVPLTQGPRTWHRVVLRLEGEVIASLRIPSGVAVPLALPATPGLRLDVLGSDAIDIPVAPGARVLIALP